MRWWILFGFFAALTAYLVCSPSRPREIVAPMIFIDTIAFGLAMTKRDAER